MNITTSIYLDFGRGTLPITVFAKRGDVDSRTVEITPLDLGQPYTLEAGMTARIQATKPDMTQIVNDCTISDGKIYADLTAQMLAVSGMLVAEIALYKNASLLSSQVFYVDVKEQAYHEDTVISSDEFKSLCAALAAVENVDAWVEQTATGATIYVRGKDGVVRTAHVDTMMSIKSITDIMYAVRAGLGPVLFPVGYEIELEKETAITITVGDGNTGVTAATVDEDTFLHAMGGAHHGHYEAVFDGDEWRKEDNTVILLSDYGLSVTGTPAEGDKVIVTETDDTVTFVVRDHDHHEAADGHYTHTMTLEAKYVYSASNGTVKYVVFDGPEAMFYCEEALPAGTYNFTWNYATGSMVNDTYEFTITEGIPAGGQIVLGTNSSSTAITSCKISTYAAPGDTTAIESNIAVSVGSGGTALGTISATASSDENLNCAQRIMWGSNNYAQSGIRQWLNSDGEVGTFWKATNKFDRAPSWHLSNDKAYRGWMHGFGDDFLNAVLPCKVDCRTNSLFEVDSLDGIEFSLDHTYQLEDKFFILSRPEVYGSWDNSSIKDGEVLDFYEDAENADRIKRDVGGTARWAWLRSPHPSTANYVRVVTTDGSLTNYNAYTISSVAPACIIG